jgi:hypothetical protein
MKPRSWLSLCALSSFIAISAHASQQTQPDAPSLEVGADGFSWIVYGGLFGLVLSTVVLLAIWFREWQKNKLW